MRWRGLLLGPTLLAGSMATAAAQANPKLDGYKGIWFTLGQQGEYGDKYSGGLGTYTAKHRPLAVYAPQANKTFFVYGGAKEGKRHLLIMASYFDHATGKVPKPTLVLDKQGVNDPHDNASIALDGDGYVWVFVSGRGRARPGFKFRSREPYAVDAFEQVSEEEMTYPQPWWILGHGFVHCFTKYTHGRELYWNTSPDGRTWTEAKKLAGMGGHYQTSWVQDGRIHTAFNYHPGGNVDQRTNLYYVYSDDFGQSWRTVDGQSVETPLTDPKGPGLVHDFQAEGLLVYMKDLVIDADGHPAILVITSHDHMPGPQGDPRTWTLVRWNGTDWTQTPITTSTHNYDMGQLWLEDHATRWRLLAPTAPGPQRWGSGGEIVLWESPDAGNTWASIKSITHDSTQNHGYVRKPLNAHPDFYAFWADGNPDTLTPSHLYFTNQAADKVWRLPYTMTEDSAIPEVVGE